MKPFANFSWDLRSCGLHGHATYRPTESELADRLSSDTPWGEAWRCLRCSDYVLGEPHATGPADEAPIVLRGKALKDAFVLRLLAIDKGLRGLTLLVVGIGIWRFQGQQVGLRQIVDEYLPLLQPLADKLGVHLTDGSFYHWIQMALDAKQTTIQLVAAGVTVYALLQLLEATGLWLMKRWGEYVAVVGTSLFLPLEIYELVEKITVLRVLAFLVNAFLVFYLVWTKRLLGARGGGTAYEAERHETSLLEVERMAASAPRPSVAGDPSSTTGEETPARRR